MTTAQDRHNETIFILCLADGGVSSEALLQSIADLEKTVKTIRRHWFWELQLQIKVQFVDWKALALSQQERLFSACTQMQERQINTTTRFCESYLADFLLAQNEETRRDLASVVIQAMNDAANHILSRENGKYKDTKFVLLGHGIGGYILYDILTHLPPNNGTTQPTPTSLTFLVHTACFLGSPIAPLLILKQQKQLKLPPTVRVYNCFHAKDSRAARLETVHYANMTSLPPPVRLPDWRTNEIRAARSADATSATSQDKSTRRISMSRTSAATKVRNLFSGPTNANENQESIPVKPLTISSRVPLHLPILPDKRYGTHDRKPMALLSRKKLDRAHSMTPNSVIRKPSTLKKLLEYFHLEEHKSQIKKQLVTGKYDMTSTLLAPRTSIAEMDILSEAETNAGLELPVRLDFRISQSTSDNYWKSGDMIFFLLKQVTGFHPCIAFPDFMKIFDMHEKLEDKKSSPRRESDAKILAVPITGSGYISDVSN